MIFYNIVAVKWQNICRLLLVFCSILLYYSGIFPIYFLFCFSFSYFKYCSEGYLLHFLVALTFHAIHIIMEDIGNINIEHINYVQSLSLHENINKSDFYQIILIGLKSFQWRIYYACNKSHMQKGCFLVQAIADLVLF